MFGGSSAPSVADIAAVTRGSDGSNGWGNGDGWWVLIILFALFGGWGRGGYGGGSGAGCDGACATVGDVQRGFDNQGITNKLNGLENGLSSLGYDQLSQMNTINQNVSNVGYQLQSAISGMGSQLQQCCCDTQRAIDGVNYNMAQNFCQLGNTVQSVGRDIVDSQNANYRALHDELVQFRMEDKDAQIQQLQSQVQALNLAQSQANQNNYLVNTLRPCPVPAYQSCNPWGGQPYGSCACAASQCC